MNGIKNVRITALRVEASAGANINNCIPEAVQLSALYDAPVVLVHNDHEYRVDVTTLMDSVYRQHS